MPNTGTRVSYGVEKSRSSLKVKMVEGVRGNCASVARMVTTPPRREGER